MMKYDMLDNLAEAVMSGEMLCEDYAHLADVEAQRKEVYSALGGLGLDETLIGSFVSTSLDDLELACERQGFINGFRMGARIMLETFIPNNAQTTESEESLLD